MAQVIASDLLNSGRFKPLPADKMIDRPTSGPEIRFEDWRYLNSDFIVVGKLTPQSADRYAAQFELYNVLNGQRLVGKQDMTATTASLRALSHRIADIIFEQLTGVRGAFSTRVAYVSASGTPPKQQYKLLVSDYDGENPQVVRDQDEPLMSPAWSPDGTQLAYVSFENKVASIFVQTLRTADRSRVSAQAGINGAPAWSPDGTTLALTRSRKDGDVDIYTRNLSTGQLKRMTFDPGIDTEPAWSADGRKLYFNSDRAGSPQIYQIDVSRPERATRVTCSRAPCECSATGVRTKARALRRTVRCSFMRPRIAGAACSPRSPSTAASSRRSRTGPAATCASRCGRRSPSVAERAGRLCGRISRDFSGPNPFVGEVNACSATDADCDEWLGTGSL
jgi:TolB protein